jgi:hypothetical protein
LFISSRDCNAEIRQSQRGKNPELARPPALKHHYLMLPDEQTSPEQIAVFRQMTPEQRWHAAHRLYWTMRRHKAAFLHSQHPDWPESRVEAEVRDIFSHART